MRIRYGGVAREPDYIPLTSEYEIFRLNYRGSGEGGGGANRVVHHIEDNAAHWKTMFA